MSSADLAAELDLFVDFISDDHRATFVLEASSTPEVLYRNAALDALVTDTSQAAQFSSWLGAIQDTIACHASREVKLGTFALRQWSCKRLKGPWLAVYCHQREYISGQRQNESLVLRTRDALSALNSISPKDPHKEGHQISNTHG